MDLTKNDIDWRALLLKRYLHYGLDELDCMVLFISDTLLDYQPKTLLTADKLAPYMRANIDSIDSSLSKLMSLKVLNIKNESSSIYSSLDEFKEKLFKDYFKDYLLKTTSPSSLDLISENLYSYLEGLTGPLTPLDRDRVSAWLKDGIDEKMIKECCKRSMSKSGHISFKEADRLLLEMQRSQARKTIGASTVDENNRNDEALKRAIDSTIWNDD